MQKSVENERRQEKLGVWQKPSDSDSRRFVGKGEPANFAGRPWKRSVLAGRKRAWGDSRCWDGNKRKRRHEFVCRSILYELRRDVETRYLYVFADASYWFSFLVSTSILFVMCRYYYHLRPNIDKSPWTREEDANILKLNQLYGHKWTLISGFFSRRTQGSVKNMSVPTLLFYEFNPSTYLSSSSTYHLTDFTHSSAVMNARHTARFAMD